MGNHCIEATCVNCGTIFCVRYCGDKSEPSQLIKAAKLQQLEVREWVQLKNDPCPNCNSTNVYL